jgi:hypothetical protein
MFEGLQAHARIDWRPAVSCRPAGRTPLLDAPLLCLPALQDLFLWALHRQQRRPHTDPASFYQLMGIHGSPYKPYRGVVRPGFSCNATQQWCVGWLQPC